MRRMLGHSQHRSCDTSHDVKAACTLYRADPGGDRAKRPGRYQYARVRVYSLLTCVNGEPSTARAGLIEASNVNVTRQSIRLQS